MDIMIPLWKIIVVIVAMPFIVTIGYLQYFGFMVGERRGQIIAGIIIFLSIIIFAGRWLYYA